MEKKALRKPVCNISIYSNLSIVITTKDLEPGTRVNMHLKVTNSFLLKLDRL